MLQYNQYIELIQEASKGGKSNLYNDNTDFRDALKLGWSEMNITRNVSGAPTGSFYKLNFHAGTDQYDYFSVIIENIGHDDRYYLSDGLAEPFKKKFETEFFKHQECWKDFKYLPKCLNVTLSDLESREIYNI